MQIHSLVKRFVLSIFLLTSLFAHAKKPPTFTLWANDRLFSNPGKWKVVDHPCGGVVRFTSFQIPKYSESNDVSPDEVFEITAKGKKVRSWRVPVNTVPVAINNNKLIVQDAYSNYLITTSGHIEFIKRSRGEEDVVVPTICETKEAFPKSDYATCKILKDEKSGKHRIFAYEAVCT